MLNPWHQALFKKITAPYWKQRIGHAFLLMGEESSGKSEFVETLEQFLLCHSPMIEGPCGQCRACHLFKEKIHPDYCALGQDEETVSIDNVRELHSFLQKTAHQKGNKVITLYQADALSIFAANALLKSLEEPSPQTIFLLMAKSAQNVLPTIRSRCMSIQFVPPSRQPSLETDYSDLKEALFWSDSQLFNQDDITKRLTTETKETLYLFYYWVADYCRYAITKNTGYLSVPSENERLDLLLEVLSVEKALNFLDILTKAIESLNVTGINKGLLWGSLVYQWQQLQKGSHTK